jgi:hypothetical protein
MMGCFIDLTGRRFGFLIVISKASVKNGRIFWLCRCCCGEEREIAASRLTTGNTKSCGCQKNNMIAQSKTKHGMSGTKLYVIWKHMTQRCENPNVQRYRSYGGRGICVGKEWRENSTAFINWAKSSGYSEGLSLDRIDVNGNYEPGNCRWVVKNEQAKNKTTNRVITINGEEHCLSDWARISGIPYETLRSRLKAGVSPEKAILREAI